jgi:hypothetical protein
MRKLLMKIFPKQIAIMIVMHKYDCTYRQAKNLYEIYNKL